MCHIMKILVEFGTAFIISRLVSHRHVALLHVIIKENKHSLLKHHYY